MLQKIVEIMQTVLENQQIMIILNKNLKKLFKIRP